MCSVQFVWPVHFHVDVLIEVCNGSSLYMYSTSDCQRSINNINTRVFDTSISPKSIFLE